MRRQNVGIASVFMSVPSGINKACGAFRTKRTRVLYVFDGARASALTGFFARCGIECRVSGKVDVLPWRGGTARSAAAHRRAAPTARRLGWSGRIVQTSRASGWNKVHQPRGLIAAPRPDDARLLYPKTYKTPVHFVQNPPRGLLTCRGAVKNTDVIPT